MTPSCLFKYNSISDYPNSTITTAALGFIASYQGAHLIGVLEEEAPGRLLSKRFQKSHIIFFCFSKFLLSIDSSESRNAKNTKMTRFEGMLKEKLLTVGGLFYYGSATPDVGVYSTPI